jgi:hypothetical protein
MTSLYWRKPAGTYVRRWSVNQHFNQLKGEQAPGQAFIIKIIKTDFLGLPFLIVNTYPLQQKQW